MLDVLREKNSNGQTVIQVGDLVENGGNMYAWDDVFSNIYNNDMGLVSAHIVGDRERATERKLVPFSGFSTCRRTVKAVTGKRITRLIMAICTLLF